MGERFEHDGTPYTVVKVLNDVAPEHGDDRSGPVVFVVKEQVAKASA